MSSPDQPRGITRRTALRRLGAGGLALPGLGLAAGTVVPAEEAFPATACTLTPELTEGPYYLDLLKVRKNITEGKSGIRLDLRVKVIDSSTCKAMDDVAVEIWHADAGGTYSGFSAEGTAGKTYLRGLQVSGEDGVAAFRTIYPGWYPGRAIHIHLKCHVGGRVSSATYSGGSVEHTGQLFFRDATSDKVMQLSGYRKSGTRTRNSADSIYADKGSGSVVALSRRGSVLASGFTGRVTVAIDA